MYPSQTCRQGQEGGVFQPDLQLREEGRGIPRSYPGVPLLFSLSPVDKQTENIMFLIFRARAEPSRQFTNILVIGFLNIMILLSQRICNLIMILLSLHALESVLCLHGYCLVNISVEI